MSDIRSNVLCVWLVKLIIELTKMETNRTFLVIILASLLVGLVLLGLSDTRISIADTNVPNDEVASRVSKASNSSASATITITMYAAADE